MRIISGFIKYQYLQYLKSNKFVMPFTVLIMVLYTLYSSKPVGVAASLVSCCMASFLIASWIGVTLCSMEDPVSEQIITLRLKNHSKYYLSQTLFLLTLSILVSLLSVFVPVLLNIVNGLQLFNRSLFLSDILSGLLLLTVSTFMGLCLGQLGHPRFIKDRKAAVLLVFLIDIISMIKPALLSRFPLSEFVLWTMPPITKLPLTFSQDIYFTVHKVLYTSAILFLYACMITAIKIYRLTRQNFL